MKSRPIIFNGEMVRAILAGRKTQTRRLVECGYTCRDSWGFREGWIWDSADGGRKENRPPYGLPGDRLWVRERIDTSCLSACYAADKRVVCCDDLLWVRGRKVIPSIHMPRWASRITLEIEMVRIERVQDICSESAHAEGYDWKSDVGQNRDSVTWFRGVWESIYGAKSWSENPWVWVYEFRRVKNK